MKHAPTIAAIAIGGGLGALLRAGAEAAGHASAMPTWITLLGINAAGSLCIGFLLVWLEVRLQRNGGSRLQHHPMNADLHRHPGVLTADPTLPPTELARYQRRLQVQSGLYMTGLMGGLTTVSSWSLDIITLLSDGQIATAIQSALASLVVTTAAALCGLSLGYRLLVRSHTSV